jgi:hypothetical protein
MLEYYAKSVGYFLSWQFKTGTNALPILQIRYTNQDF